MHDAMTTCFEVREKLPLFVGEDLEPEAMQIVRAHLAKCPPCAQEARSASRARDAFRDALHVPGADLSSPSLWGAIQSQLSAEERERAPQPIAELEALDGGAPSRSRFLRLVGGIAAVAALVVVALSVEFGRTELPGANLQAPEGFVVKKLEEVGLKRVQPGARTLFEEASPYLEPFQRPSSGPNSLAGYRHTGRRIR